MKKLYSLIFISIFCLFSVRSNATVINVAIGSGTFVPSSFTATIGDTVVWTLVNGTHNVTSTSVPGGATTMVSGNMNTPGQSFTYVIGVAGTYNYVCSLHSGSMIASFTVSATGINVNAKDLSTHVYPNPFNDRLTVKYNGIESIEFVNVIGEKVRTIQMDSSEGKLEVAMDELPAGVYFYRTYKEGEIVETKKLIKAK